MDFGAAGNATTAASLENLGYAFLGTDDSLAVFTNLFELGLATTTAEFGSFILTSYGRHPAVTAQECTKLQEMSGGRLTMAIGRGHRSAAWLGRRPIPLAETKAYVSALRALLRGEGVEWDGYRVPPRTDVLPVPIHLSAYGPKVRRLAGEVADGAVLATGSSIPLLESFLDDVAEGARAAGRSPEELNVWLLCRASVQATRSEAMDDIRGLLAACAYRHLQAATQMETVPPEFHAPLRELQRRYDPLGFEGYQPSWDGPNAQLVEDLELDEYLASRFAIVGTPAECREQVAAIAATGVKRIVFASGTRGSDTLYARLAEALLRQ